MKEYIIQDGEFKNIVRFVRHNKNAYLEAWANMSKCIKKTPYYKEHKKDALFMFLYFQYIKIQFGDNPLGHGRITLTYNDDVRDRLFYDLSITLPFLKLGA